MGPSSFAPTHAPTIPVPIGSAQAESSLYFSGRARAASPTKSAPKILPGKAKRLPVPIILRITLVVKAAPTAHHGPRVMPASTLMVCWKGKHFVGPIGIDTTESTTPAAAKAPASAAFFSVADFLSSFICVTSCALFFLDFLTFTEGLCRRAHRRASSAHAPRPAALSLS